MPNLKGVAITSYSLHSDAEIYVQGQLIGRARNMTVGDGGPFAGNNAKSPIAAHEARHVMQQKGGGTSAGDTVPTETLTLNYEKVEWTYAEKGMPPEIALKSRAGQAVTVRSRGQVIATGTLKSLNKTAGGHKEWIDLIPVAQPIHKPGGG